MAELLGTIASGIAVAEVGMKVGGTVFKLRELWKEVQEVPDNIRVLMQEIDALVPLLSTVEDNFDAGTTVLVDNGAVPALNTTTHGQKVSVLCRSALCDLQNLVEELNAEVSSAKKRKRGVGKIKVVLKKEEMKKFQSKLERAVKLLNTAQLSHVTELVRLIPQAITQQLATITQQSVTISTTKTLLGPATSSSPAKENEVQDQELTKRSNRRQPQYYQQHRLPPTTPTYFGRILIKTFETDSSMLPSEYLGTVLSCFSIVWQEVRS